MDKLYKSSAKVSEQATDVSQKTQAAVKNANETKSILDSTTSKINQISENSRRIVEIIRIITIYQNR
jgi:methyl-accepting chemotaxis protein